MSEEVVKIEWEGKEVEVKMREITFGDLKRIMKECTKTKMVNNIPMVDIDYVEMRWKVMMASIVEAPFEVNEENIGKLSGKDGMKLLEVSDKLNSFQ